MEVGKFHNNQSESASWRARRANGLVPIQVRRLKNQESHSCSSYLKADRLQAQEEPIFHFKAKGRKMLMSQFESNQAGRIILLKGGSAFFFFSIQTFY